MKTYGPIANNKIQEYPSKIAYLNKDLKLLTLHLSENIWRLRQECVKSVYSELENLYTYLINRIKEQELVGSDEISPISKKLFSYWIGSRFHSDYYSVLFERPLDDMPLLINEPDIGVIAKWRLEI
jgi:hypothetical protein